MSAARERAPKRRASGLRKKFDYDKKRGITRNKKGQFPKGVSGNPGARPGYRIKAERMLEELASDKDVKQVLRGLIDEAKKKKPWAIEMLLKRLLPPTERRENENVTPATIEALESRLDTLLRQMGEDEETAEEAGAPVH